MMRVAIIFAALMALGARAHAGDPEAEALATWSSGALSPGAARAHLDAARQAAKTVDINTTYGHWDPYILLYIAWHESRFHSGTVTQERGGLVSCGVMTPAPRRDCPRISLTAQYIAGARHLRDWYLACAKKAIPEHLESSHHDRCALLGYAGGYALIRACGRQGDSGQHDRGHLWRWRGKRRVDLCEFATEVMNNALDIEDAVDKAATVAP